jgi:hypothetical protein
MHNVTVIYTDGNGTNTTANKVITVSKYDTPIGIQVENLYVGDTTKITVSVPANAAGDITISVDGQTITNSTSQGVAVFFINGLAAGNKTVTATYAGDDVYAFNSTTKEFTVLKRSTQIKVSVDDISAGENAVVKISNLPGDANGYVIVNVNGVEYGINVTDGQTSVSVLVNSAGTCTANVTYLGDDKYLSSEDSTTFEAAKVPANVEVSVQNATVGGDVLVTVNVPQDAKGNVTISVDNKVVKEVPVSGGENTIAVSNVGQGTHDVTVTYSGDDKYDKVTKTDKVTVSTSIKAKDMTRGWNSPYDYEAEFLDKDGHVLANKYVTIKVNGKTYKVKTDEKGIARLTKSNLKVGKYDITLINPATGQKVTEKVTIVKRIINNKNVKMDYGSGKQYVVRAIGDNGKPVGAGEVVGFKVNGVDYNGITNKNGYAKLTIKLNPKKYKITAQYRAYKVSNKIVVKQTLKLVKKAITVKKSAKSFKIKATMKWSNGKAIKGKKITFRFHGKAYTAKTNKKGVAQVTIKKSVIKTLKVGKKYKFSAKIRTNFVKGTVKIKA